MKRPRTSPWTDELIAQATELYAAGQSCKEIAAELGHGLSRNAVIGILHRTGANHRDPAAPKPKHANNGGTILRRSARAERRRLTRFVLPPPPKDEPPFLGPVNDFPERGLCRYMHGEPEKAWQMCGHSVAIPGTSWCLFHRAKCFQPSKPIPKDAPEQEAVAA